MFSFEIVTFFMEYKMFYTRSKAMQICLDYHLKGLTSAIPVNSRKLS